jgi:hypothetical protein
LTGQNPLRPRSRRHAKRLLGDAVLRKYGLRRMHGLTGDPAASHSTTLGSVTKRVLLLLWNGPAILLSNLARLKRSL